MDKKYWCVFIHRDGDVFLDGVFESEDDAKAFSESDECKAMTDNVAEIAVIGGGRAGYLE